MEAVMDKKIMTKYPAYKDSGALWLGNIPQEWKAIKVKNVFRLVIEPAPKNNDFELLSVYTDIGVKPRRELEERGNKASTTDGYWFVKKGDIVVNKLLAWMGAIGVSNYDGVTSPAYDILRAKVKIESNYFHYLFRNDACISELKRHSRGIMDMRLRLYFDKFGDIMIPFPTFKEQKVIVDFLDRKTALIDKAIGIKEKQIELLKERRQILIHKAVTRGLNPNVKLKPSGVEWIGDIPAGWNVTSVKHVLEIPICDGPHTTPQLYDEGIPFVSAEAIKNGEIDFDKRRGFISLKDHQFFSKKYSPKRNDIYMVKSGATTGNVAMVKTDIEFSIWSPLAVFRANQNKVMPNYLYNYLESPSFKMGVELSWSFGTQQNIGMGILSNLPIAYPTLEEQKRISEYINRVAEKVLSAIALKAQEIEKLKEYKATLINSAVTGKIKVS